MTIRPFTTAAIAAAVLAFTVPAGAAEQVSQQIPAVDACNKTVSAMGAPMGHTSDVTPDGRPVYRFVLRTNGLDYDVVCDATSGVVNDVTPRMAH